MSITFGMPGGTALMSSPDTAAKSGSGGDNLYLWSLAGTTRVDYAVHVGASNVTNGSQFTLWVPQVVTTMNGGNRTLGAGVTGRIADSNYKGLSGSITFVDNDDIVIGSAQISGEFAIGAPPSEGVTSGGSVSDNPTYNAYLEPSDGISQFVADAPNAGYIERVYITGTGTVKDARGNPVPNDAVQFDGSGFKTDQNGAFESLLPKGKEVTATALGGTVARDVILSPGDTVEFQYSGVSVSITDPGDGSPLSGIPVSINGQEKVTDQEGTVEDLKLGLGSHNIKILGNHSLVSNTTFEGQLQEVKLGEFTDGVISNVQVNVKDANTGRPVAGVPTELPKAGIRSQTGESGKGSVLHGYDSDDEDFEVVVADGDPRYNVKGFVRSPSAGQDSVVVELEPAVPTVDM